MSVLRPFVLCADDYAISAGVSRGILALAARGRLSATSAMVNGPEWAQWAPELRRAEGAVAIGLHLNLTYGAPLTAMPRTAGSGAFPHLGRLMRGALRRRLAAGEIRAEVAAQLDAFAAHVGRPPDFVDGHQHVHVLPVIRAALLSAVAERGWERRLWLRDPADRGAAILARRRATAKAMLVAGLAAGFGAAAARHGIATNAGFAGFSRFDPEGDYGREFAGYLVAPGERHLVMCHPGEADDSLRGRDPVVESRPRELAFLSSARFEEACTAAGLRLARDWSG